ncbi:MAG: AAA family ATPase, partial [Candidatus Moranbacteria bacterium]|nr:AAA family ATPase [Candidatus Moranbacteria bacterium]
MFLRKVEISGFKSFADRTVLDFSPDGDGSERRLGITAIVGPNGSGKSNVADAIRWAI